MEGIVINAGFQGGVNPDLIAQGPGESSLLMMSQKAVTDLINESRRVLNVPQAVRRYPYTGEMIVPDFFGYNQESLEMGGVISAVDAGQYPAEFTPMPEYTWTNGTTDTVEVIWEIVKAEGICAVSNGSPDVIKGSSTVVTVSRAENAAVSAQSSDTSIADCAVTGSEITIIGKKTGIVSLTVSTEETANYEAASISIPVVVREDELGSLKDRVNALENTVGGLVAAGTCSIPVSAWTSASDGTWQASIPIAIATPQHVPQVVVESASASSAIEAGMALQCEATTGAVLIYADEKPASAVGVSVTIFAVTKTLNITWS